MFLDAIARMPGHDGESNNAVSAYTQVLLADAPTTPQTATEQMPRNLDNASKESETGMVGHS